MWILMAWASAFSLGFLTGATWSAYWQRATMESLRENDQAVESPDGTGGNVVKFARRRSTGSNFAGEGA